MGKVIANVHQTFFDKEVAPGEVIDADAREERVLLATGRARYMTAADTATPAEPVVEQLETDLPAKKRGTYSRKDMTAESRRDTVSATITHVVPAEPPAPPAPAPAAPAVPVVAPAPAETTK